MKIGLYEESITPEQAHMGQRSGDVIIIDVREVDEWSENGTPLGSHRISLTDRELTNAVKELVLESDITVAICCRTGMRAASAAKLLRKGGLGNLKVVKGGFLQWKADGLPVDA